MKKLAILTSHPIQYYAPIFKLLQKRQNIEIKVYYTLGNNSGYDQGFGKMVSWDVPLLNGYHYEWADNVSPAPGSHHFKGIVNPGLIGRIKEWQPDAVLVFGWAYDSHLKAMRYFKNKLPVYFRGDSTLLNEPGGIIKAARHFFLKWVYQHVDHAFYVGENNKAYFKKYGLKENQLSFAPHAVDNERFTQSRMAEARALRSTFNIGNGDLMVLFAGKFEPVKNVGLLLSAFASLNQQNLHLLLAGNGIDEDKLKDQAINGAAADRIHFLDFKNQSYMPVLYQATDLFCLPSKSETWGLSINEAMACGKAILASDKVGCARDLVETGGNGATFASGDQADLSRVLQHLTKDRSSLGKMGEQSCLMIKDWNFISIAIAIENKLLNEANRPNKT